jgi:hypothetical protein
MLRLKTQIAAAVPSLLDSHRKTLSVDVTEWNCYQHAARRPWLHCAPLTAFLEGFCAIYQRKVQEAAEEAAFSDEDAEAEAKAEHKAESKHKVEDKSCESKPDEANPLDRTALCHAALQELALRSQTWLARNEAPSGLHGALESVFYEHESTYGSKRGSNQCWVSDTETHVQPEWYPATSYRVQIRWTSSEEIPLASHWPVVYAACREVLPLLFGGRSIVLTYPWSFVYGYSQHRELHQGQRGEQTPQQTLPAFPAQRELWTVWEHYVSTWHRKPPTFLYPPYWPMLQRLQTHLQKIERYGKKHDWPSLAQSHVYVPSREQLLQWMQEDSADNQDRMAHDSMPILSGYQRARKKHQAQHANFFKWVEAASKQWRALCRAEPALARTDRYDGVSPTVFECMDRHARERLSTGQLAESSLH